MTLYHGSNADIDCIDLTRGLRYKDFGKGFYLTPSRHGSRGDRRLGPFF